MARSAEDVFNSLSAKYETDRADRITAKKEASISFAAEQKKQALNPEYQARMLAEDQAKWVSRVIPEGGFEDADTTAFKNPAFEGGIEKLRHAADPSLGYSVDAFEVPHDDEPFSQEKFLRQQEMLGRNLGIPAQDVTKEMIFKKGEEQRQAYMAAAREGFEPGQEINAEFRDYGKGYFGRTLSGVRNPQTGQDLVDMFNTPEENAGYYQLYNAGKRVEDTKKAYDLARSKRDRTGGEIAGDTGAAITKFALDTSGMVYGAADLLTGGNLDKVVKLAPEYAKARQYIDDNWLSDPTKASKQRVGQSGAKRAAESKARMDKLKESGEYSFLEHGLKEQAGSAWEALKSYWDEPLALLDEVLTTAPQILTGSLVAKQAVSIAVKQATKGMTKKQAATWAASDAGKAVVAKAGERAAIGYTGLQEGMSNSVHAKGAILEKSHETLMTDSEEYRKMIAANVDPDVARRRLADDTARVVALVAGTIGIASSKITGAGKAEANLFNKGLGKTAIARNTKKIVGGGAREGVEETLQGIGGQFAENLAAKAFTKDDQDLSEGTGQAAGQGLALGLASGGGMQAIGSVPAAIGGTAAEVATGVGKKVEARRSTVRAKAEGNLTEVTDKSKSDYDPKVAVAAYAKAYSTADTKEKKQKYLSDINDVFADQIQATNKAEAEKGVNSPEYKAAKQESDETGITLGNLLNSNKAGNSTAVAQSIKALSDVESDSFGSEDIDNVINNISQGTSDIANYQSILNNPSESPELAQVKRIIEAAKTVESLKPASRQVKTEVLGPDINNWGRAGLANHIAGIHMAIKSNNDVGTQDRIEALEEFVAKQERKVRTIEEGWDKAEAENWSTDGGKRTVTWPLTGGKTWTYEIRPGSKIHAKKNIDPEIAYIKAELDLTKQMAAQKFGPAPSTVTPPGAAGTTAGAAVEGEGTGTTTSKYPDPKTTDSSKIHPPKRIIKKEDPKWVQYTKNVYNDLTTRNPGEIPGALKSHYERIEAWDKRLKQIDSNDPEAGNIESTILQKISFIRSDLSATEQIMRERGIGFPKEYPDSQEEHRKWLNSLTPVAKINMELQKLQSDLWYAKEENDAGNAVVIAKMEARIKELKEQLKAVLDKDKEVPKENSTENNTKDKAFKRAPYRKPRKQPTFESLSVPVQEAITEYKAEYNKLMADNQKEIGAIKTTGVISKELAKAFRQMDSITGAITSLYLSNLTPEQLSDTKTDDKVQKKYNKSVSQRQAMAKVRFLYSKVDPKWISKDFKKIITTLGEKKLNPAGEFIAPSALKLFELGEHLSTLDQNSKLEKGNLVYLKKGDPTLFQVTSITDDGYVKLENTNTFSPRKGRAIHISNLVPWKHGDNLKHSETQFDGLSKDELNSTVDMTGLIRPGTPTRVQRDLKRINNKDSLGWYVNRHLDDSSPIKPIFNRMLALMLDSTVIAEESVNTDENLQHVWNRKASNVLGWYGRIGGGGAYMTALSFRADKHTSVEQAVRTLVHEVGHGALYYTIDGVENNKSWVTPEQKAAVKRLEKIYEYVYNNVTIGDTQKYDIQYALTNKHEFISEAYSNPEVQNWLSTMELPGSYENVFVAFVKTVAELFGFNKDDSNVMLALVSIGDDLFNASESHFESKNKKANNIDKYRRKINDLNKENHDGYAALMKLFTNDIENTREIEGQQLRQKEIATELDEAKAALKKAIGVVDPSPYFSNLDETKSVEVDSEVLSPMVAAPANIVVKSFAQIKAAHFKKEGINVLRVFGDLSGIINLSLQENFGNPFGVTGVQAKATVPNAGTGTEVSERYRKWLLKEGDGNIEPARRDWIRNQIQSGSLAGQDLLYFKDVPTLTHAKVLQELISNGLSETSNIENIPTQEFTVTTLGHVPQAEKEKAPYKAKQANKYIGFGGKSTGHYRKEAANQGIPVNSTKYTEDDVVFVSVNGSPTQGDLNQTIELAKKALDSGATLITDSQKYLDKSNYNQGEKALAKALLTAGYERTPETGNTNVAKWKKQISVKTENTVEPEVLSPMAAAMAKVKKEMPADAVKKSAEGAKKRAKETIGDIRRRRIVERAHEEEDPEAISIVQKEIEEAQISLRQRAYNVNTELNDILAAHFGVDSEQAPIAVNDFQKKYPSDAQPKKAADFEADLAKIQPFLDRYGQYNPEGKNWLEKAYRAIKKTPVYGKLEELGKVHITDPIAQWDRELIIEGFMEQLTADNSSNLESAVQKAVFDFYNQYSVRPTSVQTNVEPSRRKLGEYLGKGKGDYSIYSYIPNFFTNWNAPGTKAKLKSLLNIKDENSKTVDTLSKFNTQFGQALNEVIETETYIGAREKTDAVLRFLNASNVLPENLVSAMSTSLFNYMGTRGGKTTSLDDRGINNLFGRKSDADVKPGQKTLLRGAGGFARPMALELGRMIRKQLNLGPVTGLDGPWIDKLDYSLGMLAFAAARNPSFDYEGQNVPLVVMNSVTQGELNQFRTPDEIAAIKDPNSTINFIRFAHFEMSEEDTEIPAGINLQMTEQTKEFSSVFESLFDLKGYVDEPTSKPKKAGPVQVQGTIQETSGHLREGAAANQQVAWGVKNTWVNLTNKLSKLNFLEMGDHIRNIDRDVHVTQRAHVKAVNDDLARDLYTINEFIGSSPKELTEEFFFKFIAQRNGRNGNTSTTINPTLKKMHRFFFGAKKWVQTIDRTDRAQMINYKIAVMAGLGMETNKFMPGELITAYTVAFGEDVKEGVYNYRPAVEALKKGIADKGSLKKKEQRAIVDAVKKAGEKYHSLDALIAVATSEIALDQNKKIFTVDIGREIDGTTNGVISSILQLTPDVELAKTILRAGGYLFKGDIEQAYAEWIRHPKNRDNYQQLTMKTRTALDKLKTNLLANTQPGPLQQDEQDKFDALQTIMGNLVERNIETGIEEVTKAGRLLHKYPLMIAAYGASIERIVRELSALVIDDFYDQLMHGATPEGFTEAQRVAKLLWQVEVLTTRPDTRHTKQQIMDLVVSKKLDTKAGIREFEISFGKTKRFEDAISQYYGVALEDSLHKQLGEFMVNRAWINGAIRVMNEIFVTLYNNRLSKFEKKEGRHASREEKTEIMEQLRDAGYLPGMAHASSTDMENYRDHLQLTQTETVDLPGASNNVKQQYGKKLPVNMLSLKEGKNSEGKKELQLNAETEQFESTSSQMKEEVFKRDTGVSPYPTGNIANDGNVQAFLMKHFDDMLNLFDASMNGIANVDASSAMANQSYDNLHAQYSMADEVKRTLERLLKANQKVPNDYKLTYDQHGGATYSKDTVQGSLLDNPIIIQGARDTLEGESVPQIAFNNLNNFLYGIDHKDGTHTDGYYDNYKIVKQNYKAIQDSRVSVEQFTNPGSGFQVPGRAVQRKGESKEAFGRRLWNDVEQEAVLTQEQTPDIQNDENSEILGSDFFAGRTRDAVMHKFDELNTTSAQRIFHELETFGNQPETPEHRDYLQSVLDDFIQPAMAELDNILIHRGMSRSQNQGWIQGENIYVAAAEGVITAASNMSTQEVYVHELFHAIWREGINNDQGVKRDIAKLWRIAKKHMSSVDFLERNNNGSVKIAPGSTLAEEMRFAEDRYNYIFDGPGNSYLHEFATMGMTNANFRNKLLAISNRPERVAGSDNYISVLSNAFMKIVDWIATFGSGKKKATVGDALTQLAKNIEGVHNNGDNIIDKAFLKFAELNTPARKAFVDYMLRPYVKHVITRLAKPGRSTIAKGIDNVIRMPYDLLSGNYREAVTNAAYANGFVMDNVVHKLLTEITGPTNLTQPFHTLLRIVKQAVDFNREREAKGLSNQVKARFLTGTPDTEEMDVLGSAYLDTDLSALLPYHGAQDIVSFLNSDVANNTQISKLEGELRRTYGRQAYNFYKIQANSLGFMMISGQAGIERQLLNPHNIARMSTTGQTPTGDLKKAEELIDQLATHYAIKRLDRATKKVGADRMEAEYNANNHDNGVSFALMVHTDIKKRALAESFRGNKALMMKGYVQEQFNPNRGMMVGTKADEKAFNKDGYFIKGKIKRDKYATGTIQLYLYITKSNPLNKKVSGITSNTDKIAMGAGLTQIYSQNTNVSNPVAAAHKQRNILNMKTNVGIAEQFDGTAQLDYDGNFMIPTVNENEEITDYRYIMRENSKRKYLGKTSELNVTLGRMSAGILDKKQTSINNEKFFKLTKLFFDEEYAKDPRKFVAIGPNVTDPKHREFYHMLPSDSKRIMKDVWGPKETMYVREDLLGISFGFHKLSFTDWAWKHKVMQVLGDAKTTKYISRIAGDIWQAIVAAGKRNTVLLFPAILKANVLSNFLISMVYKGVPPVFLLREQLNGARYMIEYSAQQKEIDNLDRLIKVDPKSSETPTRIRKRNRLESHLKVNPVRPLIKAGIFQSIIEDIDENDSSLKGVLSGLLPEKQQSIVDKWGEIIPESAKTIYREGVIAPDTELGNVLLKATQYSDFVARYALHKWNTEKKGMAEEDSINDIVRTFVDYDNPTSPELQWINDMGMRMYTKFLFRMIRPFVQGWMESPLSNLVFEMSQQILGDVSDPGDTIMGIMNQWHFPGSPAVADNAFELSWLHQMNWVPGVETKMGDFDITQLPGVPFGS